MASPEYALREAPKVVPNERSDLCLASLCEDEKGNEQQVCGNNPEPLTEEQKKQYEKLKKLTGLGREELDATMADTNRRLKLLGGLLNQLDSDVWRERQNAHDALKTLLQTHKNETLPYLIFMDRHKLSFEQHHRLKQLIDPRVAEEFTRNGMTTDGVGRPKRFTSTDNNEVSLYWHNRVMTQLDGFVVKPGGAGGTPCNFERQRDGSYVVWQTGANGAKNVLGTARADQVTVSRDGTLTVQWTLTPQRGGTVVNEVYRPRRR